MYGGRETERERHRDWNNVFYHLTVKRQGDKISALVDTQRQLRAVFGTRLLSQWNCAASRNCTCLVSATTINLPGRSEVGWCRSVYQKISATTPGSLSTLFCCREEQVYNAAASAACMFACLLPTLPITTTTTPPLVCTLLTWPAQESSDDQRGICKFSTRAIRSVV